MASGAGESEFNSARAELFEVLGHPIRIRILQTLERTPLGFAELKKAAGMESSGHLSFHLNKLDGMLKVGADGDYSLTDEGKEALRVISVTRGNQNGKVRVARRPSPNKVALTLAIIAMVVLSGFVIIQQQQIGSLNHQAARQDLGTVVINGTRYSYAEFSVGSTNFPTIVGFDGVKFNMTLAPFALAKNQNFTVTFASTNLTDPFRGSRTVTLRFSPSPYIRITFGDGTAEHNAGLYISSNQKGTNLVSFLPDVNPWFSRHSNPRAGIFWNSTSNSYVFYVSLSP